MCCLLMPCSGSSFRPAPGSTTVTRDGKRFLVNIRMQEEQAAPLTLVTNWLVQFQNESGSEVPKNRP